MSLLDLPVEEAKCVVRRMLWEKEREGWKPGCKTKLVFRYGRETITTEEVIQRGLTTQQEADAFEKEYREWEQTLES